MKEEIRINPEEFERKAKEDLEKEGYSELLSIFE